jgi:hypothetical protein
MSEGFGGRFNIAASSARGTFSFTIFLGRRSELCSVSVGRGRLGGLMIPPLVVKTSLLVAGAGVANFEVGVATFGAGIDILAVGTDILGAGVGILGVGAGILGVGVGILEVGVEIFGAGSTSMVFGGSTVIIGLDGLVRTLSVVLKWITP